MLGPGSLFFSLYFFFVLFCFIFFACVSKVLGRKKEDTKVGKKDT